MWIEGFSIIQCRRKRLRDGKSLIIEIFYFGVKFIQYLMVIIC